MKEKSEDFFGNRATAGGSWNIDRGGSFFVGAALVKEPLHIVFARTLPVA